MVVNQRNRIGDFELDTVAGPRGHSKAVLLPLIDQKSRLGLPVKRSDDSDCY